MPLFEAIYTISNVGSSNFLSLTSSDKSEVVACFDANPPGSKWNLIELPGSNRYHLQNFDYPSSYAWCNALPQSGATVFGNSIKTEWVIKETQKSGHYTISPADDEELFWGLEDHKADTPVELKNVPTLAQNQWQFRYHCEPVVVKAIIDSLHLTLDWLDTTTQGVFEGRVSGTLQGSNLPADASISFPTSVSIVWNNLVVGYSEIKATYGASGADETVDNILVTATPHHATLSNFVKALLKQKLVTVEIRGEVVTVHAGGKDYPNIRTKFCKPVVIGGFDYLKGQVFVEKIKITGSDPKGDSVTALTSIAIKNPSNVSVLIDELPVEVFYEDVKIASVIMKSFKLHHRSTDTEFRAEVPVKFQPDNPRDKRCKEFIAKYITTQANLDVSFKLERTVVKLASATVAIPRFSVACIVYGIDKHFLTSCTGYVSLFRALLTKKVDFSFEIENPIDGPLTLGYMKGEASRKHKPLLVFEAPAMNMTVLANDTLTSPRLRDATLQLSTRKMITFLGKRTIEVEVELQRATVSIDKFTLPDLNFKLPNIRSTLKWSL